MQVIANQQYFNLDDFDIKHRIFPNACRVVVQMSSIATPTDQVPVFDAYGDRVGVLNDFEAVAFYSNFNSLFLSYSQNEIIK